MTDINTGQKDQENKHVTFAEKRICYNFTKKKRFLQTLEVFLEGEKLGDAMISKESILSICKTRKQLKWRTW